MRTIQIDLTGDGSAPLSAFGGFEGEHNATELTLVLPQRLLESEGEYYMIFEIQKTGQVVFSAPLIPRDGRLTLALPRQVMVSPVVGVHAALYRRQGETLTEIAKSGRVYLDVKFPEEGRRCAMKNDGGVIPGLVIDQALNPEGENPVSGKAVYQAIQEVRDQVGQEKKDFSGTSQGRSAKYTFSAPGWYRILHMIRSTSGSVDLGLVQGEPYRMTHVLAFDLSGYVRYYYDPKQGAPEVYKRYENIFGQTDAMEQHPCRITKVRVGYPKRGAAFPRSDGIVSAVNPVNCYLDIYVDFKDKEVFAPMEIAEKATHFPGTSHSYVVESVTSGQEDGASFYRAQLSDGAYFEWYEAEGMGSGGLQAGDQILYDMTFGDTYGKIWKCIPGTRAFNFNFAGFADSHNCVPIEKDTPASDTGLYGEALDFYTMDVDAMPCYLTGANVHVASESSNSWGAYGVTMSSDGTNRLRTAYATNADIDGGWNKYKVIVPYNLKYAVEKVLKGQKEQTYQLITRKTFAELDILHGAVPDGKSDAWREVTIKLGKAYKAVLCSYYFDPQKDKSETRDIVQIFSGNQGGSCYLGIPEVMSNAGPRFTRAKLERKNGLWWADYTVPAASSGGKTSIQTTQTGFCFARDLILDPTGSPYEDHLGSTESITGITIQTTMPSDGNGRTNPSGVIAVYGILAD